MCRETPATEQPRKRKTSTMAKICMVFHDAKVEDVTRYPKVLGANPPMTMDGMENLLHLLPVIRRFGPYHVLYCSRMARASDAASVFANFYDLDFHSMEELGQKANLDKASGEVIYYPGCEQQDYVYWQQSGVRAMRKISTAHLKQTNVLVTSHRPVIGGIVAHTKGITTNDSLKGFIHDPELTKKGYVLVNVDPDDGLITLLE